MKWNELKKFPNILSLSRPFFFFPLTALTISGLQWLLAGAIIYAIGAATDLLDGWLARKQGQVTVTGKLIDPLADKLFFDLVPLLFYPLLSSFLRCLFVFIFLPLEFLLLFGGLYALIVPSQNLFLVGANQGGKWKTAGVVVFTVLLFSNELVMPVSENYLIATLSSATGFALMSFIGHINKERLKSLIYNHQIEN